jgi:5-methylcytosine-specific restriction endonuclease McrA
MRYRRYITSFRWRGNAARLSELAACRGRCRLCFEPGSRDAPLEVHHATYRRLGGERFGELVALCGPCHRDVEDILRRRLYARRPSLRADVRPMRDGRRPLVDPTR